MSAAHALNAIDKFHPCTMLDVGARNCAMARYFAKHGFTVHAIDPYPQTPLILAEGITFEKISLEDYQPRQKFDLVTASFISHLVTYQTGDFILRLKSLTNDNGLIYVTLLGAEDGWSDNPKAKAVNPDEAKDLIKDAGLHILYRSEELYHGKLYDRSDKYWNILKFILQKK